MGRRLTRSQLARKLGVDRSLITRWTKSGVLRFGNDKKIDFSEAEDALRKNVVRRKPSVRRRVKGQSSSKSTMNGPLLNSEEKTLVDYRCETERLRSELLGLKVALQRGDLVPKGEGLKIVYVQGVACKTAFWTMPDRLCHTLAILNDPNEIRVLLRKEVRLILTTMVQVCSQEQREEFDRVEGPDAEWEEQLEQARGEREEVTSA